MPEAQTSSACEPAQAITAFERIHAMRPGDAEVTKVLSRLYFRMRVQSRRHQCRRSPPPPSGRRRRPFASKSRACGAACLSGILLQICPKHFYSGWDVVPSMQ